MAELVPPSVLRSCSQLGSIPHETVAELAREVESIDLPWSENYSEYQSGGWKTVALYNSDGCSQSNDLEDGDPMPTEVAVRLPRLRQFIEASGLSLMWARLLRLEPGACLWEHTDYGAVNLRRAERLRLHVPLVTNPGAVLVFPSHTVHMLLGYWWKLAADEERHGACNFGTAARLHLILDCYVDAALRRRVSEETLAPSCVREKQPLSLARRAELESGADALLGEGRQAEAELVLRRAFHDYALGDGSSYDLLIALFERNGDADRARHWRAQRRVFLNANVPGHPFFEGAAP